MYRTIKINKIGDNWWYQPPIFTMSRRKWMSRPYKNLKKLLINEKLFDENFILSLNGDKNLNIFNMINQLKNNKISFSKIDLKNIFNNQYKIFKIPKNKIWLIFDKKSIKSLYKGFLPYISFKSICKEYRNSILIWRFKGFLYFPIKKLNNLKIDEKIKSMYLKNKI